MRPMSVVILAFVILGGVQWFLSSHSPASQNDQRGATLIQADDEFAVQLTLTFDVGPDEFSLNDVADAPSLLVQLNGNEVFRKSETIAATESPILIPSVPGVVVGQNEFYVQASPSEIDVAQARAVRVSVLRGGNVVATETLWPEIGDVVQGTVQLEVASQ